MTDDSPRRRPRFEPVSRPSSEKKMRMPQADRRDRLPPSYPENIDFDPPTNPRGRKFIDPSPARAPEAAESEAPTSRRPSQDSFQPVRVPPRASRAPLPLWTRAWVTGALIIAVGGGAVGVVRSLRSKSVASGGSPDKSGTVTATAPPVPTPESKPPPSALESTPAPSPAPPAGAASPAMQPSAPTPIAASALAPEPAPMYAIPGAPMPRTPPPRPGVPANSQQRSPKSEVASDWRPVAPAHDELDVPLAPASSSASPAATGSSEAWVTEERRF